MRERREYLVMVSGRELLVEAESRAEAAEIAAELLADVERVVTDRSPELSALPSATAAQLANQVVYRTKYRRR